MGYYHFIYLYTLIKIEKSVKSTINTINTTIKFNNYDLPLSCNENNTGI
jgi:hypothetical protein